MKKLKLNNILKLVTLLGLPAGYIYYFSNFNPSAQGVWLAAFISVLICATVIYEKYFGDDEFINGKAGSKDKKAHSIFVLLVFMFAYFAMFGVYGVVYGIHSLIGDPILKQQLIVTLGKTGRKRNSCDYTIAIIISSARSERVCIEKGDFIYLKEKKQSQGLISVDVVYKESAFGSQFIEIEK